jgi:hypothetical protein
LAIQNFAHKPKQTRNKWRTLTPALVEGTISHPVVGSRPDYPWQQCKHRHPARQQQSNKHQTRLTAKIEIFEKEQ